MRALNSDSTNPSLRYYDLGSLLSYNDLCRTWSASEKITGNKVFIRTGNQDSDIPFDEVKSILVSSYKLQKTIRHSSISVAKRIYLEDNNVALVYSWLDETSWLPVGENVFLDNWSTIMVQLGLVVDFLHANGLVHGDLKLENVLWNQSTGKIMLCDLDFVSCSGTAPKAKIFGTPGFIAPEIERNEEVSGKSDLFSLGVSISRIIEPSGDQIGADLSHISDSLPKLKALATDLSDPIHDKRPNFLIDHMRELELIETGQYEVLTKRLLATILISAWKTGKTGIRKEAKDVWKSIISDNKVLGLGGELQKDYVLALSASMLKTLKVFIRHLRESAISRLSDYWSVDSSDAVVLDVMMSLEDIYQPQNGLRNSISNVRSSTVERILAISEELEGNGYPLKSYFLLREGLSNYVGKAVIAERTAILEKLASTAIDLNRISSAKDYALQLVSDSEPHSDDYLSRLLTLVEISIKNGDQQFALETIEKGLEVSGNDQTVEQVLMLRKERAWISGAEGDHGISESELREIAIVAEKQANHRVHSSGLYGLGILYWRKKDFRQALEQLNNARRIAEKYSLAEQVTNTTISLAMIHREMSEYHMAVKWAKQAVTQLESVGYKSALPSAFAILILSLSRLGRFDQARYWLQRDASFLMTSCTTRQVLTHTINSAYLLIRTGELRAADRELTKVLQICKVTDNKDSMARAYFNRSEIALFRGEHNRCLEQCADAIELFGELSDTSSIDEVESIRVVSQLYYGTGSTKSLLPVVDSLLQSGRRSYAALTLFHALLNLTPTEAGETCQNYKSFLHSWRDKPAPEMQALTILADSLLQESTNFDTEIASFKKMVPLLRKAKSYFLLAIIVRKIGSVYCENGREILGVKFLKDAERSFLMLGNEFLVDNVKADIAVHENDIGSELQLIQSFEKVSEILVEIDSYGTALERVVRFAVDQVGAERGALLIGKGDPPALKIEAFVNCDEASFEDIQDISSQVPLRVSLDHQPMVVDNALADKRTKSYRSIIHHNILSVACVPVISGAEVVGVLYLDHHTIPGLFDRKDLAYIRTVANLTGALYLIARKSKHDNAFRRQVREDLKTKSGKHTFVTADRACLEILEGLYRIAQTHVGVLLTGESGTGKDIICHLLHENSLRADKPLLRVNCSALAPTMVESELFGITKNAATGVDAREGKFSAADGGTLFFDEIGEMPLEIQAKLLRAVENQEFQKIGSNITEYTDIKFIFATNKNLGEMVDNKQFRKDLYYRICGVGIELPALRERRGDVPLLIDHFINLHALDQKPPRLTKEALAALEQYSWPGNVREMKNLIERLCILSPGRLIELGDLPKEVVIEKYTSKKSRGDDEALEKSRIIDAFVKSGWNQTSAARTLGMSLSSLRRRMKKFGLSK